MKKLLFKIGVPDKYTGAEYKEGNVYEFENKRADEILMARTPVTNEPYAVLYKDPIEEEIKEVIEEEKPMKRSKKKKEETNIEE